MGTEEDWECSLYSLLVAAGGLIWDSPVGGRGLGVALQIGQSGQHQVNLQNSVLQGEDHRPGDTEGLRGYQGQGWHRAGTW